MKLSYTNAVPNRIGQIVPYNEIQDGETYTHPYYAYYGSDPYTKWQRRGNDEWNLRVNRLVGPDAFLRQINTSPFLIVEE